MLEINTTLFIQIINFLVLLFLLNLLLFRPIRGVLNRRNEEMSALRRLVEEYGGKISEQEKGIEEGIVLARKEGYLEKEKLKTEGLEEEKNVLQEAGSSAEDKIRRATKEMEEKLSGVRKALDEQVSVFSRELAEKVLGRSL